MTLVAPRLVLGNDTLGAIQPERHRHVLTKPTLMACRAAAMAPGDSSLVKATLEMHGLAAEEWK